MLGIELGLTLGGPIYTLNILGDGVTRMPEPNGGCSTLSGTKHTLSNPNNSLVKKIEVWRDASFMLHKIKITYDSGGS